MSSNMRTRRLVKFVFHFSPQMVVLQIEDNGKGFDAETCAGPKDGHFGLLGIRERAERLGGQVQITSGIGHRHNHPRSNSDLGQQTAMNFCNPTAKTMKKEVKTRILVADDHYVVRMGVIAIINDEPDMEVVAEAANGTQAIDLFNKHQTRPGVAGFADAA